MLMEDKRTFIKDFAASATKNKTFSLTSDLHWSLTGYYCNSAGLWQDFLTSSL